MVKLTANQRKALFDMTMCSRVNEKFMPKTIKSLMELGYVGRVYGAVSYRRYYRITDAGRAALERSEG